MRQTDKKLQIKQKAMGVFAKKGFEATTMQNIADAVGIKKQSRYAHFDSKKSMYKEILEDQHCLFVYEIEKTIRLLEDESTENVLKGIFRTITIMFSDRDRLLLWKRMTLFDVNDDANVKKLNEQRNFMSDFFTIFIKISPSRSHQSIKPVAFSFLMMIEGYLDFLIIHPVIPNIFDLVWDNFWNGVKHHF